MTGQPQRQKTGQTLTKQVVTVPQQHPLMTEVYDPVEVVRQTFGLGG
jgi:hypothetical protein